MNSEGSRTRQLVHDAQKGDSTACDELFRRYYPRMRRHTHHRVGNKLRLDLDSQDIVQDSVVVALRKLSSFQMRSRASLMSWLCSIIENQIRNRADWQNASCRDRGLEVPLNDCDAGSLEACGGESPFDDLADREQEVELQAMLSQLPRRYYELIHARHFEGLDWETIARRFRRPSADAARMMYCKGIEELASMIRARNCRFDGQAG